MSYTYILPGSANGLAGVVFRIWKKFYFGIWRRLKKYGLLQDWRHEGYKIALELSAQGFYYGHPELPSKISQAWYDFLVRYGFFKRDGKSVTRRDLCISEFGENFFYKARQIYDRLSYTLAGGQKFKAIKWKNGDGKEYIFTMHFLKRWKERINCEFRPRAVQQQLWLGKVRVQKFGPEWIKARIKCPWFTLVVVEYKEKRVFITVFQ